MTTAATPTLTRQSLAAIRREQAARDFPHARELAWGAGLDLQQHSDTSYSISKTGAWEISLYPESQRMIANRCRPKMPPGARPGVSPWRLEDVVRAVAKTKGASK